MGMYDAVLHDSIIVLATAMSQLLKRGSKLNGPALQAELRRVDTSGVSGHVQFDGASRTGLPPTTAVTATITMMITIATTATITLTEPALTYQDLINYDSLPNPEWCRGLSLEILS